MADRAEQGQTECPFHGPDCVADPREGQDFDWREDAETMENFQRFLAYEHDYAYEEWSYNDERAYLLCECGARTPVPLGPDCDTPT